MSHSTSLVVSATILFKAMNKIISQQRRLAIFFLIFLLKRFQKKVDVCFFSTRQCKYSGNAVSENKNIQSYNDLRLQNA